MRLPDCKFYLFGMGNRRKILYKQGMLLDAQTGETIRRWDVSSDNIHLSEYAVKVKTKEGKAATIREDENGVWVEEDGKAVCLTRSHLRLPRFEESENSSLLRVLHHEVLVNIVDGKPVPNFLVYPEPWYRDAAMICMCLEKTGNLGLVEDWISDLREPFDRNNSGVCEPDNLGQVLYMISLVSDASHPLVQTVVRALPEVEKGKHIVGPTDYSKHPVYQTKWVKFGLRHLGLDDPYEIPKVFDGYSALFWMDYKEAHVDGPPFNERAKELYPYLGWAEAHFHGWSPPMKYSSSKYPVTWEADACQADYTGMSPVSQEYVERRICSPHAWHSAEMFLYLLEESPS